MGSGKLLCPLGPWSLEVRGDQGRVGVQVVVSTVDGRSMMRSMADCVPCRAYSPITARINSMDTSHTVSLLIVLMCLPLLIRDHESGRPGEPRCPGARHGDYPRAMRTVNVRRA